MGGGGGFSRFATAARASPDFFLIHQNANGKNLFMIWANRLKQFINGHWLIAGLEKFLELPLGVGLFGDLFGLGNAIPVDGSGPSPSRFIARI